MANELKGKVALVTGGSRGIGAAIVRKLATQGAKVVLTTSKSVAAAEALVQELGADKVSYVQADSADRASVRKAVKGVVATHGQLDILVNNAGVFEQVNSDDAVYDRQNAINVDAVWAAVQEASTVLKAGGRIVNVGSVLGERSLMPGITEYSASKAAVAMLTKGWARDFGPRGITVNAVEPGPIDTDMNPANNGEFAESQRAMIPLGRYGRPEEVAAVVAFLASAEASFVNGAAILVDGGVGA